MGAYLGTAVNVLPIQSTAYISDASMHLLGDGTGTSTYPGTTEIAVFPAAVAAAAALPSPAANSWLFNVSVSPSPSMALLVPQVSTTGFAGSSILGVAPPTTSLVTGGSLYAAFPAGSNEEILVTVYSGTRVIGVFDSIPPPEVGSLRAPITVVTPRLVQMDFALPTPTTNVCLLVKAITAPEVSLATRLLTAPPQAARKAHTATLLRTALRTTLGIPDDPSHTAGLQGVTFNTLAAPRVPCACSGCPPTPAARPPSVFNFDALMAANAE